VPAGETFAAIRRTEPVMASCPECEYDEIDTEDYEEGDDLSCPECGKALVVAGVDELEAADEDDLDDDLDDDEDDEDETDEVLEDEEESEA
jgi:ssDNA-binding Zn-finger/Zn-ribbon topoisomerase 1